MTSSDLDLVGLRKTAESASMGRWRVVVDDARNEVRVDAEGAWIAWTGGVDEEGPEFDATHIATFGPETVLAMLDRIEQLEADLAEAIAGETARVQERDAWRARAENAEAKLERIRELVKVDLLLGGAVTHVSAKLLLPILDGEA